MEKNGRVKSWGRESTRKEGLPPKPKIFAAFVDATLRVFYGDFNRRVLTENLFEISKRAGVGKYRLADLVTELGFSTRRTQMCILIYCLGSNIL